MKSLYCRFPLHYVDKINMQGLTSTFLYMAPQGHNLNKPGRGSLDDAIHNIYAYVNPVAGPFSAPGASLEQTWQRSTS